MPAPVIYHIALAEDWRRAQQDGAYRISTLGRTLDDEGFVHTSRPDQLAATARRYYAGVREPLVLLHIDPDRLSSPVVHEPVGDDTFPHVLGPVDVSAVVEVTPLHRDGDGRLVLPPTG